MLETHFTSAQKIKIIVLAISISNKNKLFIDLKSLRSKVIVIHNVESGTVLGEYKSSFISILSLGI